MPSKNKHCPKIYLPTAIQLQGKSIGHTKNLQFSCAFENVNNVDVLT